jgi:hypothetical protein
MIRYLANGALAALAAASAAWGASMPFVRGDEGSWPLTRKVPARITALCAAAVRQVDVPVVCPPLVPAAPVLRDPALVGASPFSRRLWSIQVNGGDNRGTIHWLVGGGDRSEIARWLLSDHDNIASGKPQRIGGRRVAGARITLYLYPPSPAGGVNGGHVLAAARGRRVCLRKHPRPPERRCRCRHGGGDGEATLTSRRAQDFRLRTPLGQRPR